MWPGGRRLFSLEEEPGGSPASTSALRVAGRQVCLERHVVEVLGSVCPFVLVFDLLVPQTVDCVEDALRILDRPMAVQVIEVRKISCSPCPSRSLVPEPQLAEQLVEVRTVLSPLRIVEQIVDFPEQTVEQIVDISPGDGLGLGSTLFAGAADEFTGGFRTFSPWKKVRSAGAGGECAAG